MWRTLTHHHCFSRAIVTHGNHPPSPQPFSWLAALWCCCHRPYAGEGSHCHYSCSWFTAQIWISCSHLHALVTSEKLPLGSRPADTGCTVSSAVSSWRRCPLAWTRTMACLCCAMKKGERRRSPGVAPDLDLRSDHYASRSYPSWSCPPVVLAAQQPSLVTVLPWMRLRMDALVTVPSFCRLNALPCATVCVRLGGSAHGG